MNLDGTWTEMEAGTDDEFILRPSPWESSPWTLLALPIWKNATRIDWDHIDGE